MANYRNLKELLDDHIYAPPEKTINCIKTLFSSLGKEYRRGLISEDEFLIATYYGAYISTVNPDNLSLPVLRDITIKRKALQNNSDFKNSWAEWKRTGRITVQPWMLHYIEQHGNLQNSVELLYKYIDVCKIPLSEFDPIGDENERELPALWWRINGKSTDMILASRCIDIGKLLKDPSPEGKEFDLHFEGNLVANLIVNEARIDKNRERHFICTGTITDYLEKPRQILIEVSNGGGMDVIFNHQESTPWKTLMQTFVNPIPHPKWAHYNVDRLARALRVEAEYKVLRLPYMLGIDEREIQFQAYQTYEEKDLQREGKIIKLFGAEKRQ